MAKRKWSSAWRRCTNLQRWRTQLRATRRELFALRTALCGLLDLAWPAAGWDADDDDLLFKILHARLHAGRPTLVGAGMIAAQREVLAGALAELKITRAYMLDATKARNLAADARDRYYRELMVLRNQRQHWPHDFTHHDAELRAVAAELDRRGHLALADRLLQLTTSPAPVAKEGSDSDHHA